MSRHGRPRQPRFGEGSGGAEDPSAVPSGPAAPHGGAGPETPAEGLPGPAAGGTDDPGAEDPAVDAPAVSGARVRVNDGSKVTPLADEDELEEVPAAGGRFSAWRRRRQERQASRTLTASRLPPEHEPGRTGSTAAGGTVVAFPASAGARRRRRRLLTALALSAALAVLAAVLFLSPVLAVREISVRGAELTDPASVEAALEGYRGVPLTRISRSEVREQVGRIPQVRSIEVLLEPPHHLVVELHERVPVAAVEDGGEFVVVDSEGVELTTAATAEEAGVPVVTGGRGVLGSERFGAIAAVLAALPESVLAQLRTASAESLSSVELAFTDGRTVVWGTAEDSDLKAQVLRELVEARDAGTGVETYDVSSPTRPVVR